MRFLFVSWDGGGNIPPMLALGQRLVEAGHEVTLLGTPNLAQRVTGAGLAFRPLTASSTWVPRHDRMIEDDVVAFASHLVGADLAREVLAAAETERPDRLVVDCMAAGAIYAGEISHQLTTVLVHTRYSYLVTGSGASSWTAARPLVDVARAELGLEPLPVDRGLWPSLWDRADEIIVASPLELDPNVTPRDGVVHVGPIFSPTYGRSVIPPDLAPPGQAPLVVVGHSTTYMRQEDWLQGALMALAQLNVRVVASTGHQLDPGRLKIPENVRVYRWIDHELVMASAAMVVTHAGLGTVLAALAAGVPLVCVPAGRDQFENAEAVAAVGAGVKLEENAEIGAIRQAAEEVLLNPSYRQAAEEMQRIIERYGYGARAVSELSAMPS